MRIELFTVDEANRVAGEVRPRLERLVMKKREIDRAATLPLDEDHRSSPRPRGE